ncbi:MAG: hypothetical protein AB1649_32205 [Chloroflexota bacterium]
MNTSSLVIAVIVIVIVMLAVLYPVFVEARKVNLTAKTDEKPEWMRESPPKATIKAAKTDDEGVTVFDHDEGEQLAAPFAEQIEDILRARMEADPYLKNFKIDFGTSANGEMEFWINDEKYTSVDSLPDERLKQAVKEAIKQWNK